MNTTEPFDLLLDIEKRTVKSSAGLPMLDQVENDWVGIAFRIGDLKLVAAMSEVKEILDLPEMTKVPGVKSWIVGVANVRGSLLPVMDLKGYLLGEDIKRRHKGRVIVINYKGFNTGLVVEEIYGMRHFRESDKTADAVEAPTGILPYIERVFKQDDEYWPVLSFYHMTRDERFAHASL